MIFLGFPAFPRASSLFSGTFHFFFLFALLVVFVFCFSTVCWSVIIDRFNREMGKDQGYPGDVRAGGVGGSTAIDHKGNYLKQGKGKRLWKKVRYQLVEYHALPGYLKDNEYILGHYRSEWPLKQALLSIFTIHNETLNVWT